MGPAVGGEGGGGREGGDGADDDGGEEQKPVRTDGGHGEREDKRRERR